jgi:hypothetical protein
MTAGRAPTNPSRVNDPMLDIPFDAVLYAAIALGCLFALWSAHGLNRAYRAIGRGWMALDVPFTDDRPVDRGGSR